MIQEGNSQAKSGHEHLWWNKPPVGRRGPPCSVVWDHDGCMAFMSWPGHCKRVMSPGFKGETGKEATFEIITVTRGVKTIHCDRRHHSDTNQRAKEER